MIKKILKFLNEYKKYLICVVIIILSIISVVIQHIDRKNSLVVNGSSLESKSGKIVVYITGEVKTPGVYYLDEGARLFTLIDMCGGLLDSADTDKINLAQKLNDSEKINIAKKKETVEKTSEVSEEYDIDDIDDLYEDDIYDDTSTPSSSKININTASKSELMTLNGIGDATAQKIIDYRSSNQFSSPEEIMNVPGIGSAKYEKIKDYISAP